MEVITRIRRTIRAPEILAISATGVSVAGPVSLARKRGTMTLGKPGMGGRRHARVSQTTQGPFLHRRLVG